MLRDVTTEKGIISYHLTQKKVKNINMRVKSDGSVWVSASPRIPMQEIDLFVAEKADFVLNAQEKFQDVAHINPHQQEYVQGGTIYFLGEPLTLDVVKWEEKKLPLPHQTGENGRVLEVPVHCETDEIQIQKQVFLFYNSAIHTIFTTLMNEYQKRLEPLGIPFAHLKVRDMKSRWGTCHTQKKVITLNSKLIFTPMSAIEYVVLHEFCHFIHPNHSKDFYNLVATYMPHWKAQREELKKWSCR